MSGNGYTIISRHFLRRTARGKQGRVEKAFEASGQTGEWVRVIKEPRGPYRYYVVVMKPDS